MSLPEKDEVRLRHMLQACEEATSFCTGRQADDLETDKLLRFGLVHTLTIVGEAASRVSQPTRDLLPDVPWSSMTGMRNRLVHAYFRIDTAVVWRVVAEELPPLMAALRGVLPSA